MANGKQLQGKELTYNNIVDLQAAWDLAQEFDEPVCAIIKHTNPCGTATGKTLAEAYRRALECDPVSAFGGVIGVNRPIDARNSDRDGEAVPGGDCRPRLRRSRARDLRREEEPAAGGGRPVEQKWVLKNVSGGVLLQDNDVRPLTDAELKVVTERKPTEQEMRALLFAWKVCKHVKSNAILYARDGQSVGVGAGQMSRVDSAKIGAMKGGAAAEGNGGSVGRVLSVPGRRGGDRQGGRDGDHPARRLGARSGSDRRRQPAGTGDGVHRRAALPALSLTLSRCHHTWNSLQVRHDANVIPHCGI